MSANIITSLVPVIYRALDTIPRELVGCIPAVRRWPSQVRVAKNQTITFPIVPKMTMASIVPAAIAGPDASGITVGNDSLSMTNVYSVDFPWTGEEAAGLDSSGLFAPVLQDEFAQAFRVIANGIEADLCALAAGASRAYGVSSTVAFSTADDLSDLNFTKKILKDNGAPQGDLHLVLDTNTHATMQSKQTVVYKANEYGSREGILMGTLAMLQGVNIHESGGIVNHTAGTSSNNVVNSSAGLAIGTTTIPAHSGSGTILAGDVVRFATSSDAIYADQYVVKTALNAGAFTIAEPGLKIAAASEAAITVMGSHAQNFMFDRNAIVLISALPNLPPGGDIAADTKIVVDPVSGLQFEIAIYKQYMQNTWSVRAAWGVKVVKPAFIAKLLTKIA